MSAAGSLQPVLSFDEGELSAIFVRLGVALGLGLLVGLQRERTHSRVAGFRTFPLVTVLGAVSGLLAAELGGLLVAGGLVALALVMGAANLLAAKGGDSDPGMTTEVALLLMFGTGALAALGPVAVAVALGGGTAVLLHLKEEMHGLAGRISDQDARAIMQFVLVSLVVLPVLPDRTYGPFEVLNPRQIWWMVVLIVGVSLGGYLAFQRLATRTGTLLGGVLGGLVSSTATTVSYARRSVGSRQESHVAALVISISSTVVFVRVLVEMVVVAPRSLLAMAPPVLILMTVMMLLCIALWRRTDVRDVEVPEPENPSELGSALLFAALYAGVLFAVAAMERNFGRVGLYTVATLSGLTDMDAITLSTAQLVEAERLSAGEGWRAILVAAMSNLLFKGGTVALLGGRDLLRRIVLVFGVAVGCGLLLVLLWP